MKESAVVQIEATKGYAAGERYSAILGYFYPEFVTSLILYSGLHLLDSYFIAQLPMLGPYATLGVTNTLFHFITKIAEGFLVGMVVLCGYYNGAGEYKQTGRAVVDSFWATCVTGGILAGLLYIGAQNICIFYEVSAEISALAVPFLKVRALGVFFTFVYFALIGFLRGIKNTNVPMCISLIGAAVFIFFDYALIFGKFGFQALGFQGSALAFVVQYSVMFIAALIYILTNDHIRKYSIELFVAIRWRNIRDLVKLSWPVMLDKATLAASHIWLAKMIGSIAKTANADGGKILLASFGAIKDIERFALLPAIALAQVITFLVSNDYKIHHWQGITSNLKKILLLSTVMVAGLLLLANIGIFFIAFTHKQSMLLPFVARMLPIISIFAFFDVLQLILSAALRGAADVKTVMWIRVIICACYFFPISYMLAQAAIGNILIRFIILYGALYSSNAFMCLLYLYRFKTEKWKRQIIEGS